MHEVLVNRLGGLSLPRKSVVRLTDRPDMTLDVYRGRKTTIQQILAVKAFLAPVMGKSCYEKWTDNKPGVFYFLFYIQSYEILEKKWLLELLTNRISSRAFTMYYSLRVIL